MIGFLFIDILIIAIIIWSIETSNVVVLNNLNKYYGFCGWVGVGLILIFNLSYFLLGIYDSYVYCNFSAK